LILVSATLGVTMTVAESGGGGCGSTRDGVSHEAPGLAQQASTATGTTRESGLRGVERRLAEWDHDGDAGTADAEVPHSLYDGDDREIRDYGHAASATDRRAVTALVDRYYGAAAAGDGVTACSLIDASLASALVESNGQLPRASQSAGQACAAYMSKTFEHLLGRSAADLAAVEVVGVRVKGSEGLALLRLRTSQVRDIPVSRRGGAWKIEAFFDSGLG
jgi:hypothetical protein